jgi:hypothetical protein
MKAPILRALRAALLGCLAVGMLCIDESPAAGSTLNLSAQYPDLGALSLTASYEPSSGSTGTFSVTGWPTEFTLSGTNSPAIGGSSSYNLTAIINKLTGDPVSGSFAVDGTIPSLGASSGTLLTGTLSQFGYQDAGGDIFEFVFKLTGGDLAHYYSTNQIGIILTATGSGFTGSFLTPFGTDASQAVSDNYGYTAVPEPSTGILLVGVLACVLPVFTRRRWCASSCCQAI